jgi:glycine/D-amino acid oxidase-like deaminating enzyme
VARLLILGGGCRGLALAREAQREGHAVRVVTRIEVRRAQIEAAGAECWIGDPDRLGTLRGALEGVTLACWLLGTATGSAEQLRALHGPRLRAFVGQAIDTTVRGFVYEVAGTSVPAEVLARGASVARDATRANAIPLALVEADPRDRDTWLDAARVAVGSLLEPSSV